MTDKQIQNNIIKFSKYCQKNNYGRPKLQGAYIRNGMQMLCDGFMGAVYKDVTDGTIDVKGSGIDMERICEQISDGCNYRIRDSKTLIERIEKALKVTKQDIKQKNIKIYRGNYLFDIFEDSVFNVKMFLMLVKTFKDPVIYVGVQPHASMYIVGENGEGVLMGTRYSSQEARRSNGFVNWQKLSPLYEGDENVKFNENDKV